MDARGNDLIGLDRRTFLAALASVGAASTVFERALSAAANNRPQITSQMIQQAEWIANIELDDDQREALAKTLNQSQNNRAKLRTVKLGYEIPPALIFNPALGTLDTKAFPRNRAKSTTHRNVQRPDSDDALAFMSVNELGVLLRTGQLTSVELTRLYLDRLERYDPLLKCVVTRMDDLAMTQAKRADAELASGRDRGPLHGVPWGAKDLIAYPGYPTTWGAEPFRDQVINTKATSAARLEKAGAVLIAKLSLGALAQGDRWFGGMTRNPWNPEQGSSGSSAGSASAVSAGLVGFALGSETLGSIVSPCTRCGATGLRPTFGRVSRHGCMTLSWSMDKIGPIARSVEDCALIFDAIHGADGGLDPAAVDAPFDWPGDKPLSGIRVGYVQTNLPSDQRPELQTLKQSGVRLISIELPRDIPAWSMRLILETEAAAAFERITNDGVTEGLNAWPQTFRRARFVSAVDYIRANRVRTLLMRRMAEVMESVDVYVGGDDLMIANLTGHPTVVMPNGFEQREGVRTPNAVTFTGRLLGETDLLTVAHVYQQAMGHHLEHPMLGDPNEA